jgi:MFS family permease
MQQLALTWLVYRQTNSPFILGIIGFASQFPTFLIGPLAGVLADRFNRHRIIILTQTASLIQAGLLAWLTLTNQAAVWNIIPLCVLLGIINAIDIPARQSFMMEMIENREDIGNAIALNSSMFNGARLIGPSIAGLVIAAIGEGLCFLLNAVSFIAVIAALMAMRIKPRNEPSKPRGVFTELKEGFHYAATFRPIRAILLLLGLVSILGMPYVVLMPIYARDILHGGAHTLGFLMGAIGIGAVSGAIFLASRKSVVGLEHIIPRAAAVLGTGLILFSFTSTLPVALGLLLVCGFGMMVQMASSNTILQTIADDDKRGRVMSFYTVAFLGMAPFGSLLAGSCAGWIGAPTTLLLCGIFCIIGGGIFAKRLPGLNAIIRPVYARKGLIPEIPV